jgi:hypothetical protein
MSSKLKIQGLFKAVNRKSPPFAVELSIRPVKLLHFLYRFNGDGRAAAEGMHLAGNFDLFVEQSGQLVTVAFVHHFAINLHIELFVLDQNRWEDRP